MILSITGPSGVGKTTLLSNLLKALPNSSTLVSVTTRERRPTDEPGEYEYVSEDTYQKLSAAGEFLWEAHPHGKHYATRKASIDEALAEGLYIPVLVVEAVKILHEYAKSKARSKSVHSIYLWMEDETELRKRLERRGDMTSEALESRLIECREWNMRAKTSGAPFHYLDAKQTPEKLVEKALQILDL